LNQSVEYVQVFKALADETRLKIVEMLSCGEMCACEILEYFQITQPTLSYHMRILMNSGIILGEKEGAWMRYRLNENRIASLKQLINVITTPSEDCICRTFKKAGKCN
jgi:ArsR family transcriptional regulator